MESGKDKVYTSVRTETKLGNYNQLTAAAIADRLQISRSVVSQYLNALYLKGIVIKIATRPVYFLDRQILEKQAAKKLADCFKSLEELACCMKHEKKSASHAFDQLIGARGSLSRIIKQCKASISYPPNGIPVLLHGPTGTGKSYLARIMYEYARDKGQIDEDKTFTIVNCSEYANNPELLSANLFGYCKGAFTGADQDHTGLLSIADGGILFLDEVHCLRAECQEKLFLFMDQGIFHKVGDNEKWYHSQVRLLFATTEEPEKVLLKTLLRRIPMILEIPALKERGAQEKMQFLYHLLEREEKKLKMPLTISNQAFNLLMRTEFTGNIGALENCVQVSCVNASSNTEAENQRLEIHVQDLPEHLVSLELQHVSAALSEDKAIDIEMLKQMSYADSPFIRMYKKLLQDHQQMEQHRLSAEQFQEQALESITQCMEQIEHDLQEPDAHLLKLLKNQFQNIENKYGLTCSNTDIHHIACFLQSCRRYSLSLRDFLMLEQDKCRQLLSYLQETQYRRFAILGDILKETQSIMDLVELTPLQQIVMVLYAHKFHEQRQINRRIGVILAHGRSTASSMAEAVNHLVGQYVFDGIDMPVDVSTKSIIKKLNEHLDKIKYFKEIVLLVDMGSLEDIYQGLQERDADIGIMNNVNTRQALDIGFSLLQELSLEDIFNSCMQYSDYTYKVVHSRKREKVILCSCASGIGAAEKLKDIILLSLPKGIRIKVVTYDYGALLMNQRDDPIFSKYEVICIVGTLNPNLTDVKFIAVEDLIISETMNTLDLYFRDDFGEDELNQFKQNILHNFSLSNIMNNLTILNPDKLLEHVAKALDRLQELEHMHFSSHICFGLYVHICCLIERLVTQNECSDYIGLDVFEKEHTDFIQHVREAFADVEKFYRIRIHVAEIGYIYDYIKNN